MDLRPIEVLYDELRTMEEKLEEKRRERNSAHGTQYQTLSFAVQNLEQQIRQKRKMLCEYDEKAVYAKRLLLIGKKQSK
jgi:hypothetical protein